MRRMTPRQIWAGVQIVTGAVMITIGYLWDLIGIIVAAFTVAVAYGLLTAFAELFLDVPRE